MIRILDKGTITKHFLPYLSKAKRGYVSKIPLWEVVNAILYKLKTGVQWAFLPCKSLISSNKVKYGAIYHHFRKWSKDGSWQRAWANLLSSYRCYLDLSLAFIDGTHTRAKKGGEKVSYQGRKKANTSNTVWLTDRRGNILAFLPPMSGKHHDLYQLEEHMEKQVKLLKKAGISVDGLFLNADAGFQSEAFKQVCQRHGIMLNVPGKRLFTSNLDEDENCFDELMYKERYTIERTNAWMDAYRSLLNRFDTTWQSWNAWHCIFSICNWAKFLAKV